MKFLTVSPLIILARSIYFYALCYLILCSTAYSNDKIFIDSSDFIHSKYDKGIDFYATGNEPFWSLDIAMNQFIHFRTMEGLSINLGSVFGEKAMDANVTRFVSGSEFGLFTATISENACIDNMSGDTFTYRVIVELNNYGDANYQKFDGCGKYIPNFGLNRKWILKKIGENDFVPAPTMKIVPELQMDLENKQFGGNAGCNRFSGKLYNEFNRIRFNNAVSTMMMCDNMETEKSFLDALSKVTHYKILGNKLLLSNTENILMEFYEDDNKSTDGQSSDDETFRAYRLNDIWVLETLNDIKFENPGEVSKTPQLEINTAEHRFSGNGGCNQIFGNINVEGYKINFNEIGSTRMMCPGSIEQDFLNALRSIDSWNIENNRLHLFNNGQNVIVLKKID